MGVGVLEDVGDEALLVGLLALVLPVELLVVVEEDLLVEQV